MRILVYDKNCHNPGTTFINNEIQGIAKAHDLHLLTLCEKGSWEAFGLEQVHAVKGRVPLGWIKLRRAVEKVGIALTYRNPWLKKGFGQVVDDVKPDLIHGHYGPVGIQFIENFPRKDIPILISFHGFDASQRLRSRLYCQKLRAILSQPHVYPIFVSRDMEQRVREACDWPDGRSFLLYYGIKSEHFKRERRDTPRDPFHFVQVSGFTEKKGHTYTLQAFSRLLKARPDLNVKMTFAGSGGRINEIKQQTVTLGLTEKVHFAGFLNHEEAKALLESAHAFVHHSVTGHNGDKEGIPNALIEAMSMELPILSTFHSGIPELVEHGVNGLLVKEKEVDAYAEAMQEVLQWGYKPENREKVLKDFDYRVHMKRLFEIYKTVLQREKP